MKVRLRKILFITISIFLGLSCEENNNETCDLYEGRGNLISYELIAEFSKRAFKILIEDYYGFDASQFQIQNEVIRPLSLKRRLS